MKIKNLFTAVSDRIPDGGQTTSVFSFILYLVYGRSLYYFFWNLPSLQLHSTSGEIFAIFSYIGLTGFVESFLVLFFLLCAGLLFPKKIITDNFVTVWSLYISIMFAVLMFLTTRINEMEYDHVARLVLLFPLLMLSALGLSVYAGRIKPLRNFMEDIIGRFVIFLYLLIPLNVVFLLVVIFNNLV